MPQGRNHVSRAGLFRRLRKAVHFAFPQRRAIIAIMMLTLTVAAVNAVEPLIVKAMFDNLTGQQAISALAACAVLRELMDGTSNWLTWRTRIGLQYALLESTVGKLHTMPLRLQRSEGIGAIMTRLDRSIQGFVQAVTLILFNVFPSVVFLLI